MLNNRECSDEELVALGTPARLRVDSSEPFGSRTGVILVHGRAGNEKLMWVFSKAIEGLDPVVVAPRALETDVIGGFSWWNFLDRTKSKESPAPLETTLSLLLPGFEVLDKIIKLMITNFGVDPRKIIGVGFSQGAALLGSYALKYPLKLSKVALLAGFIPKPLQDDFRKDPVDITTDFFISHGTKDEIIPFQRAEDTAEFLKEVGVNVVFNSDDVGHKIGTGGMRKLKQWLRSEPVGS